VFIHSVYFWLKPALTDEARARFIEGARSLLTIDAVESGHIGVPAGTRRAVVDHTYSFALLLTFADLAAHERYQADPIHDRFRDECSIYWSRLVIYDSLTEG
jgi:hypothetical protein